MRRRSRWSLGLRAGRRPRRWGFWWIGLRRRRSRSWRSDRGSFGECCSLRIPCRFRLKMCRRRRLCGSRSERRVIWAGRWLLCLSRGWLRLWSRLRSDSRYCSSIISLDQSLYRAVHEQQKPDLRGHQIWMLSSISTSSTSVQNPV